MLPAGVWRGAESGDAADIPGSGDGGLHSHSHHPLPHIPHNY